MERLPRETKNLMSKIYSVVKKLVNSQSHIEFLEACVSENLVPIGLKLDKKTFDEDIEDLDKISERIMLLKLSTFKQKVKVLSKEFTNLRFQLKSTLTTTNFKNLMSKLSKTMKTRKHSNRLKKMKKLRKLRCSAPNLEVETMVGEFFVTVEKEFKKNQRNIIRKEAIIKRRKDRTKQWREKVKLKYRRKANITDEDVDTLDPLEEESEDLEDWFNQFFRGVEAVKVKNLATSPMPESIQAFLSLGAKFTPVQLDIDRVQLEKDLESWFRRLRIKEYFGDLKDDRTEEEKRFSLSSNWTPPKGRCPPLDMFIFKIRQKFDNWITPRRIRDNMTPLEREGERLIKVDSLTHVYKKEDKGSCIVRMNKDDYENNVEKHLDNVIFYEKVDNDPSEEAEAEVEHFVDKVVRNGHMKAETAEFIKSKLVDTSPGPYYEQPKTHKFDEEQQDMSSGFPARGIISCNKTPTESLQDFVDFKCNPAMRALDSYIKDTKHLLQMIEKWNKEGLINENINLVTADMENMYGNMPLELSKQGIIEYFETRPQVDDDFTEDEIIEALDICQDNNVFEFKEKLYKQRLGHATGQKQAPPVACSGAGIVERQFMNTPRDVVFDTSTRIISKPKDDEIFNSVKDLTSFWGRYIDDVFNLFRGNYKQAEWYFNKLNDLYPGIVKFTWEHSGEGGIFLNIELFINREDKIIETKYYVKPSNKRLYLNYRSCHPPHTFKSIVYSQALQGIMVNSRPEWNIEYLKELRNKFLDQGYPISMINCEFRRALEVDRKDLIFSTNKQKKRTVIAPLIVTFSPGNPNFRKWISEEISTLHEEPKLRTILPKIDVVTRQAPSIQKKVIRGRHWKQKAVEGPPPPPPGNFRLHQKNCVTCRRIDNGKTRYRSAKTGREYKVTRHYTCESTHTLYLAHCELCNVDYVGQSTRSMRARHLGHRAEIRSGADGLGRHFLEKHGQGLNLKNEEVFEENIMKYFKLTIIASVEPGKPWTQKRLDQLEGNFQKNLMSMDYNGGMNIRDETVRRNRKIGS